MTGFSASVQFEEKGTGLAVEIVRGRRSTVIATVQRALLALGIVVASYEARADAERMIERIVIMRQDGGAIDGELSATTRAMILPIALGPGEPEGGAVAAE